MEGCPAGALPERRPQITDEERAELEAEAEVLLARMARLLMRQRRVPNIDDNGNMGVPHDEFVTGWDGVVLKPPSGSRPSAEHAVICGARPGTGKPASPGRRPKNC
jgi:hypothetical protein